VPGRVTRIAAVSPSGPVDELEEAYESLTAEERNLLTAIRADPAGATALLWEAGQWFAENPLRFLENEPDAADKPILLDPAFRSGFTASNREERCRGRPA
jgi:hypothetical protein